MYIIGTAGHVDHGKSTLVKALTGTDPDRLPAEKERALTIVLGFASYQNEQQQTIGIIDVPGHERFIRNMVGGVWSLDLALLIVAADDGWMEQTEDHTAILKAMGVDHIIAVITKADLVDEQRLGEVHQEIAGHMAHTFSTTPAIITTSVHTNRGIEELKRAIDAHLAVRSTGRFPPALSVDRSFLIDGIGAVATGSLRSMTLRSGETVTILPAGKQARVKALQSFAASVDQAGDGSRIAISLQGVGKDEVKKGDLITTTPSFYTCSTTAHLLITPIYEEEQVKMKRISEVEIASATWHDRATVRVLGPLCAPFLVACLSVAQKRPWYPGQQVVMIRSGSAKVLAKATVVTAKPLNRAHQHQIATALEAGKEIDVVLSDEQLLTLWLTGWATVERTEETLQILGDSYTRHGTWYLKDSLLKHIEEQLIAKLRTQLSMPLQTFKQESGLSAELATLVVQRLGRRGEIVVRGPAIELAAAQEPLSSDETAFLEKIDGRGFEGYPVKWIEKREKPTVGTLRHKGELIFVESTYVYSMATFMTIVTLILKGKQVGSTFTIAEAKEHLPVSRKYMIPLLNALEEQGFVARIGDTRQVIKLPER